MKISTRFLLIVIFFTVSFCKAQPVEEVSKKSLKEVLANVEKTYGSTTS